MRFVTNQLTDSDMGIKIEYKSNQDNDPDPTNNDQDRKAINHFRAKSFLGKIN